MTWRTNISKFFAVLLDLITLLMSIFAATVAGTTGAGFVPIYIALFICALCALLASRRVAKIGAVICTLGLLVYIALFIVYPHFDSSAIANTNAPLTFESLWSMFKLSVIWFLLPLSLAYGALFLAFKKNRDKDPIKYKA